MGIGTVRSQKSVELVWRRGRHYKGEKSSDTPTTMEKLVNVDGMGR